MSDKEETIYGRIDTEKIKAILFDIDGTLSDTDDRMVERISKFLLPASWLFKNRDPRTFARRLVMAVETPGNFFYTLTDRLGIDVYIARTYKRLSAKKISRKAFKGKFWMIPGVREMLEALNRHYPMGVVSARDEESTREFLEFFELTQFFQVIVTAQTCHHTKPFPEPVIYAARTLGVAPVNCVMIGDTIVDIKSGQSAGSQTVGVLCGFGTERELMRVGADLIISSTRKIKDYLLSN